MVTMTTRTLQSTDTQPWLPAGAYCPRAEKKTTKKEQAFVYRLDSAVDHRTNWRHIVSIKSLCNCEPFKIYRPKHYFGCHSNCSSVLNRSVHKALIRLQIQAQTGCITFTLTLLLMVLHQSMTAPRKTEAKRLLTCRSRAHLNLFIISACIYIYKTAYGFHRAILASRKPALQKFRPIWWIWM